MAPLILSPRPRLALESFVSHTQVAKQRCRAPAFLWLDEGESAEPVAELLHLGRRTVSEGVDRFHDRSELDRPPRWADAPRPGCPRVGGEGVAPRIAQVIDTDPRDLGSDATAWTAALLRQYRRDHHDIEVRRQTVSRAIARRDRRWKRPRSHRALRPETGRPANGG